MTRISFVLYRPRKGKDKELLQMLPSHFQILRSEGLITSRQVVGMKCGDGSIMVVMEWVSGEALENAPENPNVQKIWMEVDRVAAFDEPASLSELKMNFPDFEYLHVDQNSIV